ncbi:MAG TPA: hypothetical protein VF904_17860 [Anaeromyxobacteraceae bacterium]
MTCAPLVLALALGQLVPPSPPEPLRRSGVLGLGVVLEPLAIGAAQGISGGGMRGGLELVSALLVDAGPRWAVRIQLDAAVSGDGPAWAMLGLTPGVVYRFRDAADQSWIPYLGGAVRLGVAGADRPLLGLPSLVGTTAAPLLVPGRSAADWHHHDGWSHSGSSGGGVDVDGVDRLGAFPELWAGGAWHPARWLAIDLGAAYTYVRLGGRGLHVLHERVGLRLEL